MTDLAQLIGRLEAASEGSRELDDAICDVTGGASRPSWAFTAPVTTSLDAIVALIERKLPGWSWGVSGALSPTCTGMLYEPAPTATGYRTKRRADGKTPALALCIAFLRALQAQQETSEDE